MAHLGWKTWLLAAVLGFVAACSDDDATTDTTPSDVFTDADADAAADVLPDTGVDGDVAPDTGRDAEVLPETDAESDTPLDTDPDADGDGGTEPVCERTFHVAATGRGGAAGTIDDPWGTVDEVNNADLLPGDCVLFRRGDRWSETLNPPSSGAPDRPIVFGAYGAGAAPILTGAANDGCIGWVAPRSHLAFRNLHLQGCGQPAGDHAGGINVWSEAGTSTDILVDGLVIEGVRTWGIYLSGVRGLTIRDTAIHGAAQEHGIYLDGTLGLDDAVIEGCDIHHNAAMCVQFNSNGHRRLTGVVLRYNRLHDCGLGGVNNIGADGLLAHHNLVHGAMPGFYNGCDGADRGCSAGAVNGTYANNTIVTEGTGWAACFSNGSELGTPGFAAFVNNICVHDAASGAAYDGAGAVVAVSNHNIFFSNRAPRVPFEWNGTWYDDFAAYRAGTGNDADSLFANPTFVGTPGAEYQLLASSPAVDSAAVLGFTRDLLGTPVPSGGGPDRGAFERP